MTNTPLGCPIGYPMMFIPSRENGQGKVCHLSRKMLICQAKISLHRLVVVVC